MNRILKKITKAFRLAAKDPRLFYQHCKPYITTPPNCILKMNSIRFQIDLDLDPAMERMYYGLYETEITSLLRKYLRQGDIFFDVGANVGYISAFGLGLVGKIGEVHAFEPVPRFFKRLMKIEGDNPDYHIYANNVALGADEGVSSIAVTNQKNIGWNTMVPGFMSEQTTGDKIDVPVMRLDTYLLSKKVQKIRLIKIDTEGYEFPVLKGISEWLRNCKELPIIITEVAPDAYSLLHLSLKDFQEFMRGFGYVAYTVDKKRPIDLSMLKTTTNVIFLSDNTY